MAARRHGGVISALAAALPGAAQAIAASTEAIREACQAQQIDLARE